MSYTSRNYKYFWSLLPGVLTIMGNLLGGWWVLSNLIFSIGFLALVEWFMPEDKSQEHSASPFIPDLILVLHALLQVLSLTALFYSLHAGRIVGWQIFWVAVSTGVHSGSSSLIIAHEMIHRKKKHWQMLGKMLLFSVSNVYFYVDHLRVHHKWVGTERDPATAKYGESLYAFFLRSTFGQIASAWNVEVNRLKSEKSNPYGFRNYVLTNTLLLLMFYISLVVLLGKIALLVFLLQSLVANFLLEYTNYIEHYGLTRNEKERVNETHSWQTDKVISRFILIDLSRHSDHHFYASKAYHTLQHYEQSPVLPGGYASAIYMALIPPVWFHVIHKRLTEYHKTLQNSVA
ncbi:MAG: alkane 1-monooxygenase [Bacteroidetes bacterium]|nr:alkane 1-monooxygenase [Bacteroidota bacterium]